MIELYEPPQNDYSGRKTPSKQPVQTACDANSDAKSRD